MSLLKTKTLKYNIPCTFHTITKVNLDFSMLPVFNELGEITKEGSVSSVKICGYPSYADYCAGEPPTSVETVKIPFMVALESQRQTLKTGEKFCWDWIQANVPFYTNATWVDG